MPVNPITLADDLRERLALPGSSADAITPPVLAAAAAGHLPAVFAALVSAGCYEQLRAALRGGEEALRALAEARPHYDADALNAAAIAAARARRPGAEPYDLLIVPGYTPVNTTEPTPLERIPAACKRVEQAYKDYQAGLAPFLFLTGGAVHPAGTPHNEALMMRAALLDAGLPESALLVDPHARHSTTNLRNAGRLMRALGLPRGLIVTGFDSPAFSQAFYFGHPTLSTFDLRCRRELGYSVGELEPIDDHHVAFLPSAEVDRPGYDDPLDV